MPRENGYNFLKNGPFLPRFPPVVAKIKEKRDTQKSEKTNSNQKIRIFAENAQKSESYRLNLYSSQVCHIY